MSMTEDMHGQMKPFARPVLQYTLGWFIHVALRPPTTGTSICTDRFLKLSLNLSSLLINIASSLCTIVYFIDTFFNDTKKELMASAEATVVVSAIPCPEQKYSHDHHKLGASATTGFPQFIRRRGIEAEMGGNLVGS